MQHSYVSAKNELLDAFVNSANQASGVWTLITSWAATNVPVTLSARFPVWQPAIPG